MAYVLWEDVQEIIVYFEKFLSNLFGCLDFTFAEDIYDDVIEIGTELVEDGEKVFTVVYAGVSDILDAVLQFLELGTDCGNAAGDFVDALWGLIKGFVEDAINIFS